MCQRAEYSSRNGAYNSIKCVLLTVAAVMILIQVVEWEMERLGLRTLSFESRTSGTTKITSRLESSGTSPTAQTNNDDERFRCYSLQDDLTKAFEDGKIEQTFIVMPAKASGTSLKAFAGTCMGDPEKEHHPDNFMDSQNRGILPFFHNTLEPPALVASHLSKRTSLVELIRHATAKTLIIYIYREETERLMSAIAFVLKTRICPGNIPGGENSPWRQAYDQTKIERHNETDGSLHCSVPERSFIEHFVKPRYTEIGFSVDDHLSCPLWEEIDETAPPRMLFVHYSQSDLLQKQLAKHYCPNATTPVRENVSTDPEETNIFLRTVEGKEYEMKEWLRAKRNTFEYAYKLNGGGCKYERRSLESRMESCTDQSVQAFRKSH